LGDLRFALRKIEVGTVSSYREDTSMFLNLSPVRLSREPVQRYRATAGRFLRNVWADDKGQDIAEYAVMLAVILVIVVGTIRLIGSNANTVFSQAASSIQ
jgi:Flp pilus assembly pilin Flp